MLGPRAARRPRAFYGWWMVLFCTIVRGITAPGQTIGVSAFTDHLIDALETSRSAVSTAYMVGTLTGAVALPFVGRWIDRAGVRHTLSITGIAFAAAVMFVGSAQNIIMLAMAFVGLRMLGQGSLSLIGTTGIVVWFENRRGFALALSGMGAMAMMALSPLAFGALINAVGWRTTWLVLGLIIATVLVPLARFAIVDRPEVLGQLPDGVIVSGADPYRQRSFTVSEALWTPAFWTLTSLTILMGAVSTGLTFHNTDLLGERGLTETQAATVFVPLLVGSVSSSFVVGWLTDRVPSRPLMFAGGGFLALASVLATTASPGVMAAAYGLCAGLAVGAISAANGALLPKWFGVDHIGSIKGVSTTMTVVGSAVGPLILSIGNDVSDSYTPVVVGTAIACAAMAVIAGVVPTPAPEPVAVSRRSSTGPG